MTVLVNSMKVKVEWRGQSSILMFRILGNDPRHLAALTVLVGI